jgi:DNA polymerase I-like protein with 3'-5' exonuclease and polymerase domains
MATTNTIYLVSEDPEERRWSQTATLEEAMEYLWTLPRIFADTESTGFEFMLHELHSIQLGDVHKQFVFDWKYAETYRGPLQKLLNHREKKTGKSKTLVLQNATHDLPFLYKEGMVPYRIYDTLVAEQCLSLGILNYDRGIDAMLKRYCGIEMDKTDQGNIAEEGLSSPRYVKYAGLDVKALAMIWPEQVKKVVAWGHTKQVELKSQFTRVLAYIEYCGQYLDDDAFYAFVRETECEEWLALRALNRYAKENFPEHYLDNMNWNSGRQTVEFLEAAGVDCTDPDEKDKKTSDIKKLAPQMKDHEILRLYAEYRERNKTVTTYGRDWFDARFADKRIHTRYKPLVSTGRTSSGDSRRSRHWKNMQNVSNTPGLREVFRAQGNTVLVNADYSSQESVLFADQCQDPALLAFWESGEGDMHSYTARLLWPEILGSLTLDEIKEKHSDKRKSAKSAGFAIQYGSQGFSISRTLNLSKEQGEDLYQRYMKAYSGMKEYFERVQDESFKRGYILINTRSGGKRYFENARELRKWWPMYKKDKRNVPGPIRSVISALERQCLNTPTQGTAADMSAEAGNLFYDWIVWEEKAFGKVKITNFVHDEYVAECHPARQEKVAEALKRAMEEAGSYYTTRLKITATPVVSKVWGH